MDGNKKKDRHCYSEAIEYFLKREYSIETHQANSKTPEGFSQMTWSNFANLGYVSLLLPPEVGGLGGSGDDIRIVFERLGRALVVEPFLATAVLGSAPIYLTGSAEQKSLLGRVIKGDVFLSLAHSEPDNRYANHEIRSTAEKRNGHWIINGRKSIVLNGNVADYFIVTTRVFGQIYDKSGIGLFVVNAKQEKRIECRHYNLIGGGKAVEITFNNASGELIGNPDNGFSIIEQTIALGALALSAEGLGIMEICKEITLEYLNDRTQFGQKISSFQVIQHRLVNLLLEIEKMRFMVMLAADSIDTEYCFRERAISATKNMLGRVGSYVAEEVIQLHGAIGTTADYRLSYYVKRLVMLDHLLGDADFHLQKFVNLTTSSIASLETDII